MGAKPRVRAHTRIKRAIAAIVYAGPLLVLLLAPELLLSESRAPRSAAMILGVVWAIFGAFIALGVGALAGMIAELVSGAGDRRLLAATLIGLALLFGAILWVAT
jgi:uncharacterized membrane protein YGL010W